MNFLKSVKNELAPAIVVFFVALPLSLGIAVATGMPPSVGILTAILGGIVVGLLSGSPLQVSGPAAGLITIVTEIISEFGLVMLGAVIFCAGIIQLTFATLRLGFFFRAVSPSVIQGMLSAIGAIIVISQFHVVVGDRPHQSTWENLITIPGSLVNGLYPFEPTSYHYSALIGLITIAVILFWNNMMSHIKVVPPALVGVVVSMCVSYFFQLPIEHLSMPDNVFDDISILSLDKVFTNLSNSFLLSAFTVAFVATAETLLTATAIDKMHSGKRTNYDKEIFAQGVGNLTAGFFGLLPISGVIVRSSANVNSGARTRWSTVLHGLLLLIFVLALPHILERIPTSCLGAILVYTGIKLINTKLISQIYRISKYEIITYFITFFGILFTNLLEGIIMGLLVSLIFLVYKINHIELNETEKDGVINIGISGSANFVTLPLIAKFVEKLEQKKQIKVSFNNVQYLDHSCLDYLIGWQEQYHSSGGKVILETGTIPNRFAKLVERTYKEQD